jgi:hypothetical protein
MIPVALHVVVSMVTIATGIFFLAVPERAARIWGRRDLGAMANGATYRRLYRATGFLLCVAGLLFAIETV